MRTDALHDDRGAVLAVFALSLVAVIGAAALAIDLGLGWVNRRAITTSTDAASLAAAIEYATGGTGCSAVAADYLARNLSSAAMTDCDHTPETSSSVGRVRVDGEVNVPFFFAPVLGLADADVTASTTAKYGALSRVEGLRPIGVCADSPQYAAWRAAGFSPSPSGVFRIEYGNNVQLNECGGIAGGHWGIVDLNGGGNGNNDTQEWVLNGYGVEVGPGWFDADPGAISPSIADELSAVLGEEIAIPIFSEVRIGSPGGGPGGGGPGGGGPGGGGPGGGGPPGGGGEPTEYRVTEFAGLIVTAFNLSGAQADRWIEVRFTEVIAQGECCLPGGAGSVKGVAICRVEDTGDCS